MKKIIAITFLGIFIASGWAAAASEPKDSLGNTMILKNTTLSLQCSSQPVILERAESIVVEIKEMTSQLIEPNKPILPIIVKTYQVPYGSKNIQVTCTPHDINTMTLAKKIMAACIAPLSKINAIQTTVKDDSIYNSTYVLPKELVPLHDRCWIRPEWRQNHYNKNRLLSCPILPGKQPNRIYDVF